MKIKTSELTDATLDWAVAVCEGLEIYFDDGFVCLKGQPFDENSHYWLPTQNWSQGGPIIERAGITVQTDLPWSAYIRDNLFKEDGTDYFRAAPTPLIAAMRCYVASKLGDEVDVPDELTKE